MKAGPFVWETSAKWHLAERGGDAAKDEAACNGVFKRLSKAT